MEKNKRRNPCSMPCSTTTRLPGTSLQKKQEGKPGKNYDSSGGVADTDRQRTESNRNRNRSGEGTKRKQFIRLRTNRAIRQVELGLAMLPLLTSDSCRGLVVVVRGLAWS